MIKVLSLMDDPRINTGYSQTNRLTIDNLKPKGFDFVCVGFNNFNDNIGDYNGIKVIPNKCHRSDNENERMYGDKNFLIELYASEKPDILFFHNDFYRHGYFLDLPDEIKNKSVWWLPLDIVRKNNNDFSYLKNIKNLYLITKHAANIAGIENPKIISHAINDIYFNLKNSKINSDKFVICRVDRHQPRKQWPYALHAYSIFSKNKDDVLFLAKTDPRDCAGIDPDSKGFIDLEIFAEKYFIEKNKLEFINKNLTPQDIKKYIYDQSDVFLTTTGSEGFGLSIAESMACGCVPITPNGSAIPEIIGNFNNSFPYEYSRIRQVKTTWNEYGWPDVNIVAEKLEQAYQEWKENKTEFWRKSDACREQIANNFSAQKIYSQWDWELKHIFEKNNFAQEINVQEEIISAQKNISPNKEISIVIPTWNHCVDLLTPCLESIKKYTEFGNIEVIVVANGCTDNTKEYVESLGEPFRLLWFDKPLGYTRATNEGIKSAWGKYIILLNNDCVLLEQEKNTWIDLLIEPLKNEKVGLTGPALGYSEPAGRNFIIFFCAAARKELLERIGYLDEIYSPGAGDDSQASFQIEDLGYQLLQVPQGNLEVSNGLFVGSFPIYHAGEKTVFDLSNWNEIFERNSRILAERFNRKLKLCNNFERAVIGKNDQVPPREHARYSWAKKNIHGKKILEIGCSSGYGMKYFCDIPDLEYLGIDKDEKIVEYAKQNFGDFFQQADINTFNFEQYDTIIAFEVLEHLDNGKEVAQKLKKHCKKLLATIPYKEPVGLWGEHHRLHNLQENDFPNFKYIWMKENGEIVYSPPSELISLMLMEWEAPLVSIQKNDVTATISTKDRYFTTLPSAILSIANQTRKPEKLWIFDDGEQVDLRQHSLYQNIFKHLDCQGITWNVIFGQKKGQAFNHQYALEHSETEFVWRLDDDNFAEPNVLEILLKHFVDEKVGAVGGLVLDPKFVGSLPPGLGMNKIEDIFLNQNIQWYRFEGLKEVEHLYSTFVYRKNAASSYCLELSPVSHREESLFSYGLSQNGYKLLVNPKAITWHFREPTGGIRSYKNEEFWKHDDRIFKEKLKHIKFKEH